jgi:hypothetical protein
MLTLPTIEIYPMANWQITATTIDCDAVADEVTIIVYKNGSVKCTWFSKYGNQNTNKCLGPLCDYMKSYREKLFKEDEELDKKSK